MEYRNLGRSGLKVSALSFGSWVTFGHQLDVDGAMDAMRTAYDAGVNFFDNAEVYAKGKSELVMGEALKKLDWRRDSYILSSKVYWGSVENPGPTQVGLSRKHIVEACNQALQRLQVDYLDLYFCHRPDPETPIEETVRAMTELIQRGQVLYWGTSEWSAQQIMEAYGIARQFGLIPPTMEQPQYHLFHRQRVEVEYKRVYDAIGLGTTTWSPLASGILTGKYSEGVPENSRLQLTSYAWLRELLESEEGQNMVVRTRKLMPLAEELDITMPRLALAWCLKNPKVSTVITGASRASQVVENMKAIDDMAKLTEDVMAEIESITESKPESVPLQ